MTLFNTLKSRWPGSLFARLALAWLIALLVGHLFSVAVSYFAVYDYQIERTRYYLAKDLGILLPALETATPDARAAWLTKMQRKAYRYELDIPSATVYVTPSDSPRIKEMVSDINRELGSTYAINATESKTPGEDVRLHVRLKDDTPLTIRVFKIDLPVSPWGGLVFALQVLAVIVFTWLAVRQATQPLARLAEAAEVLGSSLQGEPIAEDGPTEVARAAAAFNAMQRRITDHLAERVRILAAISHDLQTPITRMRLRADLMDSAPLRDKLQSDLDTMQSLVEEGIAYARSAQNVTEEACRVDVDALLDSLVCDYVDAGHALQLQGEVGQVLTTRPHTLRRIVVNLVDNALKFASEVEIHVTQPSHDMLAVSVLDRGPGIAPDELDAVLQPFYRIESSRNRSTGGTGLGLAIAQQLSLALRGTLSLSNRDGGGLAARIVFPVSSS